MDVAEVVDASERKAALQSLGALLEGEWGDHGDLVTALKSILSVEQRMVAQVDDSNVPGNPRSPLAVTWPNMQRLHLKIENDIAFLLVPSASLTAFLLLSFYHKEWQFTPLLFSLLSLLWLKKEYGVAILKRREDVRADIASVVEEVVNVQDAQVVLDELKLLLSSYQISEQQHILGQLMEMTDLLSELKKIEGSDARAQMFNNQVFERKMGALKELVAEFESVSTTIRSTIRTITDQIAVLKSLGAVSSHLESDGEASGTVGDESNAIETINEALNALAARPEQDERSRLSALQGSTGVSFQAQNRQSVSELV